MALTGAGSGTSASDTVIEPDTPSKPGLHFTHGGSAERLRALGSAAPPMSGQAGGDGIHVDGSVLSSAVSFQAYGVVAIGSSSGFSRGPGMRLSAGSFGFNALIDQGSRLEGADTALHTTGRLGAIVRSSTLHAGLFAFVADLQQEITAEDTTIEGGVRATQGEVTLRRSRVFTPGTAPISAIAINSSATIEDSLVVLDQPSPGIPAVYVDAATAQGTATVTVRGSTLVARGADAAAALLLGSDDGADATASVRNTILRVIGAQAAPDLLLDKGGTGNPVVDIDYSNFLNVSGLGGVTPPVPGSAHNVDAAPQLNDPANGDYSLKSTSLLIDKGDPAIVAAGQTDLAGQPRAIDGNNDCIAEPDIGALEFTGNACVPVDPTPTPSPTPEPTPSPTPEPPPAPAPAATPTPTPTLDKTAPVLSGLTFSAKSFTAKKGTRVRFTLSEAASVLLEVESISSGRKSGSKCVKPTRKLRKKKKCNRYTARGSFKATGKTGANDVSFKGTIGGKRLAADDYRLKVRATDAAGNRSKQVTKTFRVTRR